MADERVRILEGVTITPVGGGRVRRWVDGAVAFDRHGTLLAVGRRAAVEGRFPRGRATRVGRSRVVLPGFVDAHTHVAQYGMAGQYEGELLDWLEKHVFPAERRFADRAYARRVSGAFFRDLARGGTTTAGIVGPVQEGATDLVFREAARSGLRCVIGKVMMDRNSPPYLEESTGASLAASERLYAKWNGRAGGRLRYAFTPRFAPTSSPRLLRGIGALAAKYDARVQAHLSESPREVERVRRLFRGPPSYTAVYARAGLVRRRAFFAHAIHLDASEVRLLRAGGAGVVHCPASNLLLGSGLMRVRELLDAGIPVGLGSDVAGGPELSLLRGMAAAGFVARAREIAGRGRGMRGPVRGRLSPAELLHLATLGGAEAMGLGPITGSLEEGKRADLVVLDVRRLDPLSRDAEDLGVAETLGLIAYRGERDAVASTWVDGREVHSSSRVAGY